MLLRGLYIFRNPAILDWRTWRKFGEHGEHGKHQPDKVKHSMIKNTLFMAQKTILQRLSQQLKNHNIQLGEHDPGSAQDWRTSSEMQSSGCYVMIFQRRMVMTLGMNLFTDNPQCDALRSPQVNIKAANFPFHFSISDF